MKQRVKKYITGLVAVACALVLIMPAYAAEPAAKQTPLPDPLTLEYALSLVDDMHPDLMFAQANVDLAQSGILSANAGNDIEITARARLQYIEPSSLAPDQSNEDHMAALLASKTLYDFGRSASLEEAASSDYAGQKFLYGKAKRQRRIAIMQRYFEAVLADILFYRYNEDMATEFVTLDRLRNRLKLGQASEIEVMKQEVNYNRVRHLRFNSQNQQHVTRVRLALAMNQPENLPSTIAKPKIKAHKYKLPELDEVQRLAMLNNRTILSLEKQLLAARSRVKHARAGDSPVLRSQAGVYAYSRDLAGRDELQAGIILDIPLSGGSRRDADTAKAMAEVYKFQAQVLSARAQVRQTIIEQWSELDGLRSKLDEMRALVDYREMYLDRSRALYEMEVKTDLGDAMVLTTQAEHDYLKTKYSIALGWEKLAALIGISMKDLRSVKPERSTPGS